MMKRSLAYGFGFLSIIFFNLAIAQTAPTADQLTLTLLAIDLSGQGTITERSALNGNAAILVWDHRDEPRRLQAGDLSYFATFAALAALDANKDGLIDARDPRAARLKLLVFANRGRRYRVVSLQDAGVRALLLDGSHLKRAPNGGEVLFPQKGYKAVMANSVIRPILFVTVHRNYLDKLFGLTAI